MSLSKAKNARALAAQKQARLPITAPAFIQHWHKIPSIFFEDILTDFYEQFSGSKTYQGYRIMAVDGTTVNMARDPKSECFVLHPGAPQGIVKCTHPLVRRAEQDVL